MSEHSNVISGSTMGRMANCPGSRALVARMPPEGEKPFADQGSVYHEVMANILTTPGEFEGMEYDKIAKEFIGEHYGYGKEFAVTPESFKHKIIPALEAFAEIRNQECEGVLDYVVEARLSLGSVIEGAFGTGDVVGLDGDGTLWIIDWKFGDGIPVSPEGNYQLGFYAGCALYDAAPEIKALADKAKDVALAIVQPRVGANRVWETWRTTLDWVEDLVDLAVTAVEKAEGANPPIKAGGHCLWCRAKPICPAHTELATDAITNPPDATDAIGLASALERATILQALVTETFALAQRELENGASIPGWKLVDKQSRRFWADADAAEKSMKRKFGVKVAFKRSMMSPNQAEQQDKKFYGHALRKHVDSKSSGHTIAPDSDPRDAVTDNASLLRESLQKMAAEQDESPSDS